jgi:hypothetical protein
MIASWNIIRLSTLENLTDESRAVCSMSSSIAWRPRVPRRAVYHALPELGTLNKVLRLPREVRPAWEKYEPACEIQILRYSGRGLSGA